MTSSLRIIFAGTPEFAAIALQALLSSPHHVIAVYTQPDRKAGRGLHLTASPVKEIAKHITYRFINLPHSKTNMNKTH